MDQEICLLLRQTDNSGPQLALHRLLLLLPRAGGEEEEAKEGSAATLFFFSFSFRAGKGCSDFCNTRPVKAVEKNLVAVQGGQGCREKGEKKKKKKKKCAQ